jgi:hypothetical protein
VIIFSVVRSLFLVLALTLLAGCGGGSNSTAPLSANNLNLIFVVSPDLENPALNHPAHGDINRNTANLSNQGLQRSLLMASYLKQQVLGNVNVTRIYALQPMTHLQNTADYPDLPDMAAIGYIQQFALLNQITLPGMDGAVSTLAAANSFPLNVTYASTTVPGGVAAPLPACPDCQGLDFNNTDGNNDALVSAIVNANVPGFHVFSAPWTTISALMTNLNTQKGYNLNLPASYVGPNHVYAISITPSGNARLVTYDSKLNPPAAFPVLRLPLSGASSLQQQPFSITVTGGSPYSMTLNGSTVTGVTPAVIPATIDIKRTIYLIRHAEAHPLPYWDDGNFLGAGQWRALALSEVLRGKISPTQVYSSDPAQVFPGAFIPPMGAYSNFSYVRPSLTVEPYAIANNLPFYLVSNFAIFDPTKVDPTNPNSADKEIQQTSDFFFSDSRFHNQTVLAAWEHSHFQPLITALLASYFPDGGGPVVPGWPASDYDTIWTVTLDAAGNLTIDNSLCQGIDSTKLPVTAPQF